MRQDSHGQDLAAESCVLLNTCLIECAPATAVAAVQGPRLNCAIGV